jgi:tetratricopeptide (TPR) repeat protein
MVKGYTLKDVYQGTLGTLPQQQRDEKLAEAGTIFEALLEEDPANVGALNGFANVLFFWGRFDRAIEVFERASELSPPSYLPTIENDLALAVLFRDGGARPGTLGLPAA